MQERYLTANGLRFHYLDWEGSGPDVIMVHPTGFVANVWQPLAERLCDRYHVVALDTRGHGDSDKPATDYGAGRLIEDLRAFIEAAGLDRPIGIGHSAGATTIAAVEAERPGTFRRAVLMEPVLVYVPREQWRTREAIPIAERTLKRRAVWPSREAAYESYRSRPPFQSWDDAILRLYVEHGFADRPDGAVELKCRPELEAQMYQKGAAELPAAELIPQVRSVVLLIRGEESTVFSAADAERTVALLPDCRLVVFPGGHFAPFEHPRRTEAEVLGFLV